MTSVFCVIESRVRFVWCDWKDSLFHFMWLQLLIFILCAQNTHPTLG